MVKIYGALAAVLLLTGCPGPGDRIAPKDPAYVTLRDNQVCITAPIQPGEKVFSVQISDGEQNNLLKTLATDFLPAFNGRFLPTFGYLFHSGHSYVAYFSLENTPRSHVRYLAVKFSMLNGLVQTSPPAER